MEIVVVGLAIAAIVIAAKFCAWVIETVGLPVLITAAVGFFIHNRCFVHAQLSAA